jgi:adenosine/AMP kinase
MELLTVPIEKPDDVNLILGQSHFIKTVDDVYEALAGSSPTLRFGLAFCESSGPCLVRRAGNDDELVRWLSRTRWQWEQAIRSSCSSARDFRSTSSMR